MDFINFNATCMHVYQSMDVVPTEMKCSYVWSKQASSFEPLLFVSNRHLIQCGVFYKALHRKIECLTWVMNVWMVPNRGLCGSLWGGKFESGKERGERYIKKDYITTPSQRLDWTPSRIRLTTTSLSLSITSLSTGQACRHNVSREGKKALCLLG